MAKQEQFTTRRVFALSMIALAFIGLFARACYLQLIEADFLHAKGNNLYVRSMEISAHRGAIYDRNGQPLAISTPVYRVIADPQISWQHPKSIQFVAETLGVSVSKLKQKIEQRKQKRYLSIKRHVLPETAQRLKGMRNTGFRIEREYRRYYPGGEMAAHLIGLTNSDDAGVEGLEKVYESWLGGAAGKKKVAKDKRGRVVADIGQMLPPKLGKDLSLSLDKRIQYVAYRELKNAVLKHQARTGSVVVLDPANGEILAIANYPGLNPNNRNNVGASSIDQLIRNRAIADVFEPGSTAKPFVMAAAFEGGHYKMASMIDTSPGILKVGSTTVRDKNNLGIIDMTTVLAKSSNVGSVKVALGTPEEDLWRIYANIGFGQTSGSGLLGEQSGVLKNYIDWNKGQRVTLAFGYGMSVTTLQLARAYGVLANDGVLAEVSFVHGDSEVGGTRVLSAKTTQQIRQMLRKVVSVDGTARQARLQVYSAAGKTGTSRKLSNGKYAKDQHIALFAGMAPATQPEVVIVVMIDQPTVGGYYGGVVAGPVFARVAETVLRLRNVRPDRILDVDSSLFLSRAQ
jgi:cell division protein FtsI (penicillin-binding protein 3)|tara:strand:+ start:98285 stop:99997 length:1713 start_codon:yes stop_codon:yes gene_type:complete